MSCAGMTGYVLRGDDGQCPVGEWRDMSCVGMTGYVLRGNDGVCPARGMARHVVRGDDGTCQQIPGHVQSRLDLVRVGRPRSFSSTLGNI